MQYMSSSAPLEKRLTSELLRHRDYSFRRFVCGAHSKCTNKVIYTIHCRIYSQIGVCTAFAFEMSGRKSLRENHRSVLYCNDAAHRWSVNFIVHGCICWCVEMKQRNIICSLPLALPFSLSLWLLFLSVSRSLFNYMRRITWRDHNWMSATCSILWPSTRSDDGHIHSGCRLFFVCVCSCDFCFHSRCGWHFTFLLNSMRTRTQLKHQIRGS